MKSKSITRCVAAFMAAFMTVSGGISIPNERVMAQCTHLMMESGIRQI